jgi:hypothetical protein
VVLGEGDGVVLKLLTCLYSDSLPTNDRCESDNCLSVDCMGTTCELLHVTSGTSICISCSELSGVLDERITSFSISNL